MTHQNDVQVTRYLDDIQVMAPTYAIEGIDLSLSLSLSRIQWVYACGIVSMVIRVRGMVVLRKIVLAVIIRERQR
jgi:hypothetical protein